jgi:putative ABC transport system permease protein
MSALLGLAWRSALNRRWTLGLTLLAMALSVALLLGVERIRHDARAGFVQSVSGTDLIVGARTGPVQLMLYSVFRIGNATNNINWNSYTTLAQHPAVAWSIPLSLGDSHRGFAVLGTTSAYFEHFRYGDAHALEFVAGKPFADLFAAVIGSEVASALGYRVDQQIALSHGMSGLDGADGLGAAHTDKPFRVVGILAPTGTPVDRTVHVSLQAMTAIHLDWQGGAPLPGMKIPAQFVQKFDLTPHDITAVLIGLKRRGDVFRMQRFVNEFRDEPLLGVMPGVALDELWSVVAVAERTLLAVSAMVVAVGLAGLVAVVLAGLNERRRELAILRSVGARPRDILLLLTAEGLFVTLLGSLCGLFIVNVAGAVAAPWLQAHFGIVVQPQLLSVDEARLIAWVIGVGLLASLVPGLRAYRLSLVDGLTPRI